MTIGNYRRLARIGLGTAGVAILAGLTGCETDSFMDPSITGRWEMTPTVMPILDRLSAIEDQPSEPIQAEAIQAQDLIPEVEQYRFGPGDGIEIIIRDFVTPGIEEKFQQPVDSRGYVNIPKLSPIRAGGRTSAELAQLVREAIRDAGIRADLNAVVAINIVSQRSQTFSIIGAVQQQQEYFIPKPNYRLLDALSTAGGFNETIEKIYVIRQVALSEPAAGAPPTAPSQPAAPAPDPANRSEPLLDLIDRMSKPAENKPNPGMLGERRPREVASARQAPQPPPIDLPDSRPAATPAPVPAQSSPSAWVYQNGQWIKNAPAAPEGPGGLVGTVGAAGGLSPSEIVTQRVIEVPVSRLLAGDATVNIVVRPGDVIRVPPPKLGVVYVTGQVVRPGPYSLTGDSKLTLLRALDSAGGLGSIAIPERTDLTRIVGAGRQATIRLNVRAIAEQTQPDIYLKPDDRINVGTNFWALPLAVLRGAFRFSYGFGFILDRNFAGDVFGVDPSLDR